MNKRQLVIWARLGFGALSIAAFLTQIAFLMQNDAFNPANFFSYFTNLSNMFGAFVLITSAIYLSTHRKPSATDDLIRGAATLYMTIVGIVYITLLSGEDLGLLIPSVNIVLHYLMPAVIIIDWLYQPQRTKLAIKQIWPWLIFPAAYLVYLLIRGPIDNWYPYPFLNPDNVGGYGGVAVYCLGILALFIVAALVLMKLGNKLKRHIT